jgi:hypothetical protein
MAQRAEHARLADAGLAREDGMTALVSTRSPGVPRLTL